MTSSHSSSDNGIVSRFQPYQLPRLTGGMEHPASIVETKSMSGVIPPPINIKLALPYSVAEKGLLSVVQLERIAYAAQAHNSKLPSGARMAFMIGDGTGVGKGRSVAGVILHHWHLGIKRALWLSASNDLDVAARQDFDDLEATDVPLRNVNTWSVDKEITLSQGVIFSTFAALIGKSKDGKHTRFDQITMWLKGTDGNATIVIDESQKAKNAVGEAYGKTDTSSQTGRAIMMIQDEKKFPDFRVTYSSATGYTELRNMAYLTRLGLWGTGTAFKTFSDFQSEIGGAGVAGLELVCRDLRSVGLLAAANLSFAGIDYTETTHYVTAAQTQTYDTAAEIWFEVTKHIEGAMSATNGGKFTLSRVLAQYWAAHQRFFSMMLLSFKVPTMIEQIQQAVDAGFSPIVSLQNTGESRAKMAVSKAHFEGNSLEDVDLTPREILANFINTAFPVIVMMEVEGENGVISEEPLMKDGQPVVSREAARLREKCLELLSRIHFPENPLDQLINHFGADKVAEISGRKKRLMRDPVTNQLAYLKRAPEGVSQKKANQSEMASFQAGRKQIAIITPAGNVGISLHASNRAKNNKRRVHFIAQFGWSADTTIQGMGRSHRTDQAEPPIYNLLATNVGGEVRFRSTIAKRIAQLGALTRGDRAAADGSGLANYNYESEQGKDALTKTYNRIIKGDAPIKMDTLVKMGLAKIENGTVIMKDEIKTNMGRFLNRLLSLPIHLQNSFFEFFQENFQMVMEEAEKQGLLDLGITTVEGKNFRFGTEPKNVYQHPGTGATSTYFHIVSDRKPNYVQWSRAYQYLMDSSYRVYQDDEGHYALVDMTSYGSHYSTHLKRVICKYRTVTPENRHGEISSTTLADWQLATPKVKDLEASWNTRLEVLPETVESHTHLIAGVVLPLWTYLKATEGQKLEIARVEMNGQTVCGIRIPKNRLKATLDGIGVFSQKDTLSGDEAFDELESGGIVSLAQGFTLGVTRFNGQDVIGVKNELRSELLQLLGVKRESVNYTWRYFLSMNRAETVAILNRIFLTYPVIMEKREAAPDIQISSPVNFEVTSITVEKLFGAVEIIPEPVIVEPEPAVVPNQTILLYKPTSRKAKMENQMVFNFSELAFAQAA